MSINDEIRPGNEVLIEKSDAMFDKLKVLYVKLAAEKDNKERSRLSLEIQAELANLQSLAIMQEEKEGREKVCIFMNSLIAGIPEVESKEKLALCNTQDILKRILGNTRFTVKRRQYLVTTLKAALEASSINDNLVAEIMEEVFAKTRQLSELLVAEIFEYPEGYELLQAEKVLGYLAIIPNSEREIENLCVKLLQLSNKYNSLVKRYRAIANDGSIFPVKKGDMVIGLYEDKVFIAEVTRCVKENITCEIISVEEDQIKLEFSLLTGRSFDEKGYLWENTSTMQFVESKESNPIGEGILKEYSKHVFVLYTDGNKKRFGIGYYTYRTKDWIISIKGAGVSGVLDKCVTGWFIIPEYIKNDLLGVGYSV